jgi:hypothetical protein
VVRQIVYVDAADDAAAVGWDLKSATLHRVMDAAFGAVDGGGT